jgi:hypothetical protein
MPGCERNRLALRRMFTQAINFLFLEKRNAPLSEELYELQTKICDFPTQNGQQNSGAVFSASTSTAPWNPIMRDKIHVICREDVTNSVTVWVLDVVGGRKKWVVKIQQKRTHNFSVARFKRKADYSVEGDEA